MRVLIIDQTPTPHRALIARLHDAGHEVELTNKPDSGLALVRSYAPNVVALRTAGDDKGYLALAETIKSAASPPVVVCLGNYLQSEHIDLWLFEDDDLMEIIRILEGGGDKPS